MNIHIYGSHNASFTIENNKDILEVIELERFLSRKNAGLSQYNIIGDPILNVKNVLQYIYEKFKIETFDTCFYMNTDFIHDDVRYDIKELIQAKEYKSYKHHESHAAGAFYQSPFHKALIFSFDGGGNDGKFNIYLADRELGLTLLEEVKNPKLNNEHVHYDLGFPYMVFGHYLKDIKFEHALSEGNLIYPGKLMGLASYGKVRQEWVPHFIDFYEKNPDGPTYETLIQKLGEKINVKFNIEERLEGEIAYDIAATSQKVFEECFLKVALPYLQKYENLPICIAGGCGLNIILNTRLVYEFNKRVFVGPNPNDCGLSVGNALNTIKPLEPIDITYKGVSLLDKFNVMDYAFNHSHVFLSKTLNLSDYWKTHLSSFKAVFSNYDFNVVVDDLINGKIVGIIQGNSEHGPRALGNRSILANPTFPEMKDILNKKVKNREWYRPFAPVVRLEDVNKYFEWAEETRWMSFCPFVKPKHRSKLSSITHVDGTARVQTVTKEQNPFLYWLLSRMHEETGIGVLLNTSFNVAGKPIVSTVKDAFTVYEQTELDCLLIENVYMRKSGF